MDCSSVLCSSDLILAKLIKIRSLNFMRGRTFLNRYIIIDEAQNLTAKQMKTLITRVGPGSKMICLGNLGQIDTPYLSETTSGLTYVVDRFQGWPHGGHVTLARGERSRLAAYASDILYRCTYEKSETSSEERSGGKEWVSTCKSRGSPG